ncbi:MAG: MFS transporter [Gammaproteobacteria bacterium]|nr:MFS transporter [Gammaproteobacteria bacterium]MBU2021274.1 MFS transporter [Gammaproteobacteria bacterium]MBU2237011.1 MFS transporter [Gammaproteobacteria bacterium]MBU2317594.1 MFS transporter [Gammaproteobacteria bacterium]MBU2415148.1 MFS transporter [Gammaproteobacteria bacterium]
MNSSPTHKPRPMVDLIVSVILPSLILMKLSGEDKLGTSGGLIAALAFPLGWGLFELVKYRKFNFIALLGLVSVLLTGSIGLFELDNKWLAIKEASIPAIIGIAVLISTFTPYPLVRAMFFNAAIMDVDTIKQKLEENNSTTMFENRLMKATYFIAGSFAFSATMNYVLAKWIVTSPAGTEAFNEELGQMTLYSYPMIAIPSMIMLMAIFYYLWRSIQKATGLKLEDLIVKK